jgi:predicted TIM-barrel fold metal-dependent hydrolase
MPPDVLEAVDDRHAIRTGGEEGSWDVGRRLQELDAEGVAAELLFPMQGKALMPFFAVTNHVHRAELRAAGARAYHRWLADFINEGEGRLFGVMEPYVGGGVDGTVRELEWAAERGFVAMSVPGGVLGDEPLPPLWDPAYEPLWAVCADRGIVLVVHAGYGHRQGLISADIDDMVARGMTRAEVYTRFHDGRNALHRPVDLGPRAPFWQILVAGVFDRHPDLRLVVTEIQAGWVPETLAVLDARFARGDTGLAEPPGEVWHRHCSVCVSPVRRVEIEMRHEIGVDSMLFGMDYVHREGTWPNTLDWLRVAFAGVPEDEARRILGLNAAEVYGLDASRLAGVAARIGPTPADVLGGHEVDPRKLDDFRLRGGYDLPAAGSGGAELEQAFDRDLASARARS